MTRRPRWTGASDLPSNGMPIPRAVPTTRESGGGWQVYTPHQAAAPPSNYGRDDQFSEDLPFEPAVAPVARKRAWVPRQQHSGYAYNLRTEGVH